MAVIGRGFPGPEVASSLPIEEPVQSAQAQFLMDRDEPVSGGQLKEIVGVRATSVASTLRRDVCWYRAERPMIIVPP
jgi:hypothetical protein